MKKIIIFNASSSLYGAERGLINLLKVLHSGFDITVVLPQRGILEEKINKVSDSVKIIRFPLATLMFSYSPFYFLKFFVLFFLDFLFFLLYINRKNIDIVVTNSSLLLFSALCAHLLGKVHIWHIREVFPYHMVNICLGWYMKLFSKKVICQSEFIKNKLGLKERGEVVYEPLDKRGYKIYNSEDARRTLNISGKKVVLSIVSRIHPSKGQFEFIKDIQDVLSKNRDVILLVVGEVAPYSLRNIMYKHKINDFIRMYNLENVVLLGFVEDVSLVYSASDICVFPFCRDEPFGICVAEALSFGKETFYPFRGGLREVWKIFHKGKELNKDTIIAAIERCKSYSYNKGSTKMVIPSELSFSGYTSRIMEVYRECI